MKMAANQLAAIVRRVDRLEAAAVAKAFAGAQDPEDREDIEIEYQAARYAVTNYLSSLNLKTKG